LGNTDSRRPTLSDTHRKELEISIVGLQNAGKSSLVHALTSQPLQPHPVPTVGFTMRKVKVGNLLIKIWDLGGQPRFRPMWERYSRGVDVIVWVVDSADVDGLDIAREDLAGLLLNKTSLRGIPCLIVGNKSDLDGSLDINSLKECLLVDGLDDRERELAILTCSCLNGDGIKSIITWLGKQGR